LAPYARKLVEREAGKGLEAWLDELGELFQTLLALPSQTSRVLAQAEGGGLVVQSPPISREVRSLVRSVDRLSGSVVFAALLVGGAMLFSNGNVILGEVLLGLAGAILLWVFFGNRGKN
jgi:hypothetical protein